MSRSHPMPENQGRTSFGRGRRNPVLRGGLTAVAGLLALVAAALPSSAAAGPPPPATPAGLAATPAGLATTPAGRVATPRLPAPTGPHPVGTTSLYLKDTSRPDPWVPEVKARELMVTLWYPATSPGGRRARYMTPKESELLLKGTGVTGVPVDILSRTRTNATVGARPDGRRHTLPLVVLSPGFTWPAGSLTSVAEELASRGYAVAGIDHTYESFATTFPDGRVTTCAACEIESGGDFGEQVVKSRAADVSFVLDELTGPHPKWRFGSLIDPAQIAMAGSSLGGASTVEVLLTNPRVRAGVNLDGTMFATIPPGGLSRPFMFMGQPAHRTGGDDPTWDRDWNLLTGWKRWLVVTGSVHASFTDYDMLGRQIGVDLGGELPGTRSVEITRRYVRAFFDLHLREKPQPLLEGPSARYPEVTFCAPETGTCS
ncbi:alpha/beta hydrolase family protein [Sphaerisporangium corydalis]|uniref:Alpha/beta hydrolase family protein n=1 Tax=Sphaerisporangium corydalis TaxID=1441875 RepID=A0ABV9ET34_9ACTN|nr:alpha/beta hydrolase [Sphaerisporangium corydalis]